MLIFAVIKVITISDNVIIENFYNVRLRPIKLRFV